MNFLRRHSISALAVALAAVVAAALVGYALLTHPAVPQYYRPAPPAAQAPTRGPAAPTTASPAATSVPTAETLTSAQRATYCPLVREALSQMKFTGDLAQDGALGGPAARRVVAVATGVRQALWLDLAAADDAYTHIMIGDRSTYTTEARAAVGRGADAAVQLDRMTPDDCGFAGL